MKNQNYIKYLVVLSSIYCVFTVMQNLFEMKTLGTASYAIMGGGTVIAWVTFLISDILAEVYGEKPAKKCVWLAGIINLAVVILAQAVIWLPGTYPEQNSAFTQIFSNGPRTVVASFIAFCVGNFINISIMIRLKGKSKNSDKFTGFIIRAVFSTVVGQLLDNLLFAFLAFAPIGISLFEMPWEDILTTSVMTTLFETVIEAIFVPIITHPCIRFLKHNLRVKE